jgi:hypothetical protein
MGETDSHAQGVEGLHGRLIAIMEQLELPAPERMLGRIEEMLGAEDRERVLLALIRDAEQQSSDETRRILKVLVGTRDEWAREVDRLLKGYPPT